MLVIVRRIYGLKLKKNIKLLLFYWILFLKQFKEFILIVFSFRNSKLFILLLALFFKVYFIIRIEKKKNE